MRRELMLAILLLVGGAGGAAHADFAAAPNFSAEETATIARVQILSDLLRGDPWLVRLVFDMASQVDASAGASRDAAKPGASQYSDAPSTRDAQGIVSWNELIRKAKERKEQRGATDEANSTRSALGIVDTNDLIRKAKAKKESGAH